MNTFKRFSFIVLALAAVLFFTGVVTAQNGQTINGDQFIVANTFRLSAGDTLNGALVVIGGTANLEQGSTVTGDVVLVGGTLTLAGQVNGSLVTVGSSGSLSATAVVNGDLTTVGNGLRVAEGAVIRGATNINMPFSFNVASSQTMSQPTASTAILTNLLWAAFRVLTLAALAMLMVLLFPKPTRKVAATFSAQPFASFGIGVLTLAVAPFGIVIMIITLILIPAVPLVIAALIIAGLYGWMSIGYEIGDRIVNQEKLGWSEPVVAGFGTLILGVVGAAINLIPCVGWVINFLVGLIGLGMVILSRMGTYPKETVASSAALSEPPAGPVS